MTGAAHASQTWHHGAVAQWWAEFNVDGPEIAYFRALVERHGQPALDVACGSGRLLLPLLKAGLDVDGCDISADMLAWCRTSGERAGLTPLLYLQAMHELDLPRRYATIYVCGGFGLGGDRSRDQEALLQFRRHLVCGGRLLLDIHVPYESGGTWQYWPRDTRALPEPWPPLPARRRTADGSELALTSRVVQFDPLAQVITREMRARRWRAGRLEADERYTLRERLYFRDELLMMLEVAGFDDIQVEGDYNHTEATCDAEVLVFIARKP